MFISIDLQLMVVVQNLGAGEGLKIDEATVALPTTRRKDERQNSFTEGGTSNVKLCPFNPVKKLLEFDMYPTFYLASTAVGDVHGQSNCNFACTHRIFGNYSIIPCLLHPLDYHIISSLNGACLTSVVSAALLPLAFHGRWRRSSTTFAHPLQPLKIRFASSIILTSSCPGLAGVLWVWPVSPTILRDCLDPPCFLRPPHRRL